MKFFNWVQSKLNGAQLGSNKKPTTAVAAAYHAQQDPAPKEEINDWPGGLLTIGTFGIATDHLQQNRENISEESEILEECSSPDDLAEFTPGEVGQLQKELTRLLKRKPALADHLPLDRFLNCPSSLEVDRTISNRFSSISSHICNKDEEDIDRTIRVIIGRCKEVCMENKKKGIGKKSISFLLKKMFVCASEFVPPPTLRDTLQESRMEKLLRTMLSKKMYPRNCSRASSTKRYLENTHTTKAENDGNETQERKREACKWVKTDSEYIVLDLH